MRRDVIVYIEDVLESIQRIREYTQNLERDEFKKDTQVQDAVLRRLEIIGEAVKRIPISLKERYPAIPWKQIVGMRDVITHAYFGVNPDRVWIVAKEQLSELEEAVRQIKNQLENSEKS